MTLHEKHARIQKELKVPKGQRNTFGNYNYRNCEDILEAVKPLLDGLTLTLTDDIVAVGDRIYVKATAILSDGKDQVQTTASARESSEKKGMDSSQITGASSSYARKYALNGMFAIDDTKDADTDEMEKQSNKPQGRTPVAPPKPVPTKPTTTDTVTVAQATAVETKAPEAPARRRVAVATDEVKQAKPENKPATKPVTDDQW